MWNADEEFVLKTLEIWEVQYRTQPNKETSTNDVQIGWIECKCPWDRCNIHTFAISWGTYISSFFHIMRQLEDLQIFQIVPTHSLLKTNDFCSFFLFLLRAKLRWSFFIYKKSFSCDLWEGFWEVGWCNVDKWIFSIFLWIFPNGIESCTMLMLNKPWYLQCSKPCWTKTWVSA